MEDSRLDKYFYMKEPDLLTSWLNYSKEQQSTLMKPTLDESIVAFIYHSCDELQLKKEIAFMAVELMAKYLEKDENQSNNNHNILCVLTMIVISNNLVGFRPNLSKMKVVNIMRSLGLFSYDVDAINKAEVDISMRFDFKFPLTTMLDDVHCLVGAFLNAPMIIDKVQKQCEYMLNVFYLNCKVICESLDEYYERKHRHEVLQRFYEKKLYFPAGICLTALRIHKKNQMYDESVIIEDLAQYLQIEARDLNIFTSVFMNVLYLNAMNNDNNNNV